MLIHTYIHSLVFCTVVYGVRGEGEEEGTHGCTQCKYKEKMYGYQINSWEKKNEKNIHEK